MAFAILLFFLALPILEVAFFIEMVGQIGLSWSLLLIAAAAIAGFVMLRAQGFAVFREAEAALARHEVPLDAVIHGVVLLAAGMLFLIPGFVSDILAFLLLLPDVRMKVAQLFLGRTNLRPEFGFHSQSRHQTPDHHEQHGPGPIIEGEYEDHTRRDQFLRRD